MLPHKEEGSGIQYQIMESDWGSGAFPPLAENRERGCVGDSTATKNPRKRSRQCTPLQEDSDPGTLPPFNHDAHPKPSKLPNPSPTPPPSPGRTEEPIVRARMLEAGGERRGKEEDQQAPGGWEESPIALPSAPPEAGRDLGAGSRGVSSSEPQVLPKSGNRREKRFPDELETGAFRPPNGPSPRLGPQGIHQRPSLWSVPFED